MYGTTAAAIVQRDRRSEQAARAAGGTALFECA